MLSPTTLCALAMPPIFCFQGLYRVNETRRAAQPFLQRNPPGRVERPLPTLFTLFKGEFWVALHRDFCEYIHESPDNVARSLQVRVGRWVWPGLWLGFEVGFEFGLSF